MLRVMPLTDPQANTETACEHAAFHVIIDTKIAMHPDKPTRFACGGCGTRRGRHEAAVQRQHFAQPLTDAHSDPHRYTFIEANAPP